MLSLLTLFAFASAQQDLFEFHPSHLNFADEQVEVSFQFRLKQRPTGNRLSAYFGAPGLQLEQCGRSFLSSDFDKWQTVKVRPVPAYRDNFIRSLSINAKLSSDAAPAAFIAQGTLPVTRKTNRVGVFSSRGDPHYITFSGRKFSFQGVGKYVLYRSTHLEIQTLTRRWGNTRTSVNKAIAVRYGSTVLVVDARDRLPNFVQRLTMNHDQVRIKSDRLGKRGIRHKIHLPGGSRVVITAFVRKHGTMLNVHAVLDRSFDDKGGLSNIRGAPKLTLRDGSFANGNIRAFAKSWEVRRDESLFRGRFTATRPNTSIYFDRCRLPRTPAPFPSISADIYPVSEYKAQEIPEVAPLPDLPAPAVNPEFAKKADAHCKSLFQARGCPRVLDPEPFISACLEDALANGDLSFSETHKTSYYSQCDGIVLDMNNGDQPDANEAAAIAYADGVTVGTMCRNNCSGRGTCSAAGCCCEEGFGGVDCAQSVQ